MRLFKFDLFSIINICIILLSCFQRDYLFLLLVLVIHEIGHIFFIKLFKIKIKKITITCIGFIIDISDDSYSLIKDLLIYSGGIIFNLILLLIPFLRNYSLILIIFNLLPIYPLDGYRIFKSLISYLLPYRISNYICAIISVISVLVLSFVIINKNYLIMVDIIFLFLLNINNLLNCNMLFEKMKLKWFLNKRNLKKKYIYHLNNIENILYYYHNGVYVFYNKKMDEEKYLNMIYKR